MKKILSLYTMLSLILVSPMIVHADERMELLQFTCRPEYDFFSVRSIRLEYTIGYKKEGDPQYKSLKNDANDPEVQHKAEEQGFYTVSAVKNKPYTCELDDRHISVDVVNYEGYDGKSECTAFPKFDIKISVDGDSVYKFSAMGDMQCMSDENHLVSIRGEELQDCKVPNLFSRGEMECSKVSRPEQLKIRK